MILISWRFICFGRNFSGTIESSCLRVDEDFFFLPLTDTPFFGLPHFRLAAGWCPLWRNRVCTTSPITLLFPVEFIISRMSWKEIGRWKAKEAESAFLRPKEICSSLRMWSNAVSPWLVLRAPMDPAPLSSQGPCGDLHFKAVYAGGIQLKESHVCPAAPQKLPS